MAQSVDGVQIVKIEGSNERATSWSDDDKSFSLKLRNASRTGMKLTSSIVAISRSENS